MAFRQSSFLTMNELRPCAPHCDQVTQGSFLTMPEVASYTPASALTASRQMFGMGQPTTQGNWLSPSQVPAFDRMSASRMAAHPQKFSLSGMGQFELFGMDAKKLALLGAGGYLLYKLVGPK